MTEPKNFRLALLFGFCALTNAAPLLNLLSPALLKLMNSTALSTAVHNITRPHGGMPISVTTPFPPGPEPPGTFFYDVPSTNPPMNLKFRDYLVDPSINKADVDNCFQQAEMECGVREKQSTEMEEGETQRWENGDVYLDIVPKKGSQQEQALTYGLFTDALRGINDFRLFYPHLNFLYEIYVYLGDEQTETYLDITTGVKEHIRIDISAFIGLQLPAKILLLVNGEGS
ncbi:hypothetical protein IMSHALPRED_001252 [Imshaugia aleurites]|uniref:Uncharacterized protein n=1 Tax=Imshaugia aleurites TaxID=172621 RepID=A0A8H3J1Y3_9LECA|nr:hypothetical protein IMSHALPRED_001252 [Imshaugia aleurites]